MAAGGRKLRLQDLLVASQVAVSLVLLVCTALFVRSMINVSRMDLGFETENRLIMAVDTELLGYDEEQGRQFFRDLLDRVRSMPGVRSAATSRFLPVGFENGLTLVFPEGESIGGADDNQAPRPDNNMVSPEYFETMGIAILDDRPFDEQDDETSRWVAVVNRTMADELWPGQDPLGKRFSVVGPGGPFLEIVGVARTCAYSIPGESPQAAFYQPMKQRHQGKQVVIVRAASNPTGLVPAIRSEIHALDPDMPISDVRTLQSHVSEGKAEILFKLPARMVGIFALIGAALAALGLYAVIAYSVGQRTHEIGVRVAVGATPSDIVRLILSKGLVLGGGVVALGVLLAWLITGRFAYLFVGVGAGDPPTYAVVSLLVLLVALTASYIPARFSAARIDPAVALREE